MSSLITGRYPGEMGDAILIKTLLRFSADLAAPLGAFPPNTLIFIHLHVRDNFVPRRGEFGMANAFSNGGERP